MRSSSATAGGSPSRPSPAASRSARPKRPSTAAPHVTSAAAVLATVAMPPTAQRRGAGTRTPTSAGSQTNVYHSGQAPYGCHSQRPASPASTAHAQAAGRAHGTPRGSSVPRTSAAAQNTSAMLAAATATSHEPHSPKLTPPAGGAVPPPRERTRDRAASTRAPAADSVPQRRR